MLSRGFAIPRRKLAPFPTAPSLAAWGLHVRLSSPSSRCPGVALPSQWRVGQVWGPRWGLSEPLYARGSLGRLVRFRLALNASRAAMGLPRRVLYLWLWARTRGGSLGLREGGGTAGSKSSVATDLCWRELLQGRQEVFFPKLLGLGGGGSLLFVAVCWFSAVPLRQPHVDRRISTGLRG